MAEVESYHIHILKHYDDYLCSIFANEEEVEAVCHKLHSRGMLTERQVERILDEEDPYDMMTKLLPILKREKAHVFLEFLLVLQQRAQTRPEPNCPSWTTLQTLVGGLEGKGIANFKIAEEPHLTTKLDNLRKYVHQRESFQAKNKKMKEQKKLPDPTYQYKLFTISSPYDDIADHKQTITISNRVFYSSRHGIRVCFDCQVFEILEGFQLYVGVCDCRNENLPPNYLPCTPTVWIATEPMFLQFPEASVSVSIPHCATINCLEDVESLFILALDEPNAQGTLDWTVKGVERIDADFVSSCHAQFYTSHFTYYKGIKRSRSEPYDVLLRQEPVSFMPPVKKFSYMKLEDDDDVETDSKPRCRTWSGPRPILRAKHVTKKQLSLESQIDRSKPAIVRS